jgi:hypothetical protein
LIQRAEEASGRLAEEWWAADIREVISDLVAALAAAHPAADADEQRKGEALRECLCPPLPEPTNDRCPLHGEPAEDAPRCEGDCNPFIAACGARFCDETAWHQHQRTCTNKPAEGAPSLATAALAWVREVAAKPICSDPGEREQCYADSGPYCGTHLFDDYLVKEARAVLGAAPVERKDH